MNQSETDLGIVNESQFLRFGITSTSHQSAKNISLPPKSACRWNRKPANTDAPMRSQLCSESWEIGAPFRIKLRTPIII